MPATGAFSGTPASISESDEPQTEAIEDELASLLRLGEGVPHDLLGDADDLDVHLEGGHAFSGTGDLEVHVAEVVLRSLDVREDHVVVALLDKAHRDTGDR